MSLRGEVASIVLMRHGQAASSDAKAVEAFCDETWLFGKRCPRGPTAEENAMPGHKPMKDRLTLLLCANASGDFKVNTSRCIIPGIHKPSKKGAKESVKRYVEVQQ